jgi:PTS system nitrogen regulatory IIA component
MNIADILDVDSIVANLRARDKKGVLEELVSVLVEQGKLRDKEKSVQVLLERERLGSTGIGEGIAIPHGKLKDIPGILCSFGRTKAGIDFQSIDEKPTHLFFLLLAPEDSASEHLQALARVSRLLKDDQVRKRLIEANSKEEIYHIVAEGDMHYALP